MAFLIHSAGTPLFPDQDAFGGTPSGYPLQ